MNLVKLTEEVYVDPSEVVSVERETLNEFVSSSPSDGHYVTKFDGSRIILKCGRKAYVPNVMPAEIIKLLGAP